VNYITDRNFFTIKMLFSEELIFNKRLFSKRLLFLNGFFKQIVDWNRSCDTPAGAAGQVRSRKSRGGLSARPAESEHPEVEINTTLIATLFTKTV
jgi:hypothetical protein